MIYHPIETVDMATSVGVMVGPDLVIGWKDISLLELLKKVIVGEMVRM
jgi:hypothetical protein